MTQKTPICKNLTALSAAFALFFFLLPVSPAAGNDAMFNLTEDYSTQIKSNEEPDKHFWRALLETAVLLGIFQYRYKKTHTSWVAGVHKYQATWEDQKEKLFNWKNWNYDANCYDLNWQHALAGGVYYNFSRTNNLSVLESLLMSWASSSYWEFVVEYRSDVSINDHIFTPLGGLPLGEAWFQLGKFFADRPDTLSQVLSFINPILKINRFFDRESIRKKPPEPPPGWHAFNLDLGVRRLHAQGSSGHETVPYAGLETEIIHIPEYGASGIERRFISEPLFSEIRLETSGAGKSFEEADLTARAVWFGLFQQNIDAFNRGYAFYLGGGSAFTMFKKKPGQTEFPCTFKGRDPAQLKLDAPRDFTDKMSAVHIIGPVFDLTLFARDFTLRWVQDIYVDFAISHSFAFNAYTERFDYGGVKTPLLVNGYYYGWGTTLNSRLDLTWSDIHLQAELRYQRYGSIDGKDRFQHVMTDDFHLTDSRLLIRTALDYRIPGLPVALKAAYEGIDRRGWIKDIEETAWESKLFFGLSLLY